MSAADQAVPDSGPVGTLPLALRGPAATGGRRRLWLLAVPAVRHHYFFGLVRGLCGVVRQHQWRPAGTQLFDKTHVFIETSCLLASSVTCGFATLAVQRYDKLAAYIWMIVTFVLGVGFLSLERAEFASMVASAMVRRAAPFCRAFSRWSARMACM